MQRLSIAGLKYLDKTHDHPFLNFWPDLIAKGSQAEATRAAEAFQQTVDTVVREHLRDYPSTTSASSKNRRNRPILTIFSARAARRRRERFRVTNTCFAAICSMQKERQMGNRATPGCFISMMRNFSRI